MKCSTCDLVHICKIYEYSFAIEISKCKFYQQNKNHVDEDNNSTSSLKEALNYLCNNNDSEKQVIKNKNNIIKTVTCSNCNKEFDEYDITETLDGRKLCPQCYQNDTPIKL